jgi:myo-inositol-1(or 4)-monophosphatase
VTDDGVAERVDHVERAAVAGAEVAFEGFEAGLAAESKGGADRVVHASDVVTAADRDAQRAVTESIRERFPEDPVVGEEGDAAKTVPDTGVAWVVDPIDGTYNFVRGLPSWSTAVALSVDGGAVAAATVAPAMDRTYLLRDGQATRDGAQIRVADRTAPETFAVAYTFVPELDERDAYADGVEAMLHRFGEVRRVGSLQVVLALVASGALDGAVTDARVNPWDSVGGVALVRAAGGVVTDLEGDRWTRRSTGLVASAGTAHEELLAVGRRMAGDE